MLHPTTKIFICILITALVSGCGTPGAAEATKFFSKNLSLGIAAQIRSIYSSNSSYVDLNSTLNGSVNGVAANVTAGTARLVAPNAIAARGTDDYLFSFSQYNGAFPGTGQYLLSAIPAVGTTSMTWPTVLGGFTLSSQGSGLEYNFLPMIAQQYGGSGALAFLSVSAAASVNATSYDMKAWIRSGTSNFWLGNGGSSSVPTTLGTGATDVNALSWNLCTPKLVSDYAGGFMSVWCGEDTVDANTSCVANGVANYYSPYSGWQGTAVEPFHDSATLAYEGAALNSTTVNLGTGCTAPGTFTAAATPNTGAGIDFHFFPDASSNGWGVQVQYVYADDVYTLYARLFDGQTRLFSSATAPIGPDPTTPVRLLGAVDVPTGEVIFDPKIYVKDDDGNFSVFYLQDTANLASTTVDLNRVDVTYDRTSITPSSPAVAAPVTVSSDISTATWNAGEYFGPQMVVSPSGTSAYLLYLTSSTVLNVLEYSSSSDTWTLVKTISSPVGNIVHFAGSVSDNGDKLISFTYDDIGTNTSVKVGVMAYIKSRLTWDTSVSTLSSPSTCVYSTARVSTVLDNNAKGMISVSCESPAGTVRNIVVPYR